MSSNSEKHVITYNALVRKRGEIVWEIEQEQRRAEQLRADLVHLDAVLRMFRPDFKAEGLPVRHRLRTMSPYFKRGEMTKRIYDAMREKGVIASIDVALVAMRDKGVSPNDKPTRTDFVRRVGLLLSDMARKGKVERIGHGRALRWKLPSE